MGLACSHISGIKKQPDDPPSVSRCGTETPAHKILLLGTGLSGKSTILKQMRLLHDNGFSLLERQEYAPIVLKTFWDATIKFAHLLKDKLSESQYQAHSIEIAAILEFEKEEIKPATVSLAQILNSLWTFDYVREIVYSSREFPYVDCASYFFANALKYTAANFCPDAQDILHTRTVTTGVNDAQFNLGKMKIRMIDVGGQRIERDTWIHSFNDVQTIIYCIALSDYDLTLKEDPSQNRMLESIALFEAIVNSRWFRRTSVVLFLNKIDLFKLKIAKSPLEDQFEDYKGGSDIKKALKYILFRFTNPSINRSGLKVYPHVTQATDTSSIQLVFATLQKTILENVFDELGFV